MLFVGICVLHNVRWPKGTLIITSTRKINSIRLLGMGGRRKDTASLEKNQLREDTNICMLAPFGPSNLLVAMVYTCQGAPVHINQNLIH